MSIAPIVKDVARTIARCVPFLLGLPPCVEDKRRTLRERRDSEFLDRGK